MLQDIQDGLVWIRQRTGLCTKRNKTTVKTLTLNNLSQLFAFHCLLFTVMQKGSSPVWWTAAPGVWSSRPHSPAPAQISALSEGGSQCHSSISEIAFSPFCTPHPTCSTCALVGQSGGNGETAANICIPHSQIIHVNMSDPSLIVVNLGDRDNAMLSEALWPQAEGLGSSSRPYSSPRWAERTAWPADSCHPSPL